MFIRFFILAQDGSIRIVPTGGNVHLNGLRLNGGDVANTIYQPTGNLGNLGQLQGNIVSLGIQQRVQF